MNDPLYLIFEQHLYTAMVEDESTDELMARVVTAYMGRLTSEGTVPASMRGSIEQDLREEVLEMFRKKTYGHYNLASYRKSQGIDAVVEAPVAVTAPEKEKARRGGRAC